MRGGWGLGGACDSLEGHWLNELDGYFRGRKSHFVDLIDSVVVPGVVPYRGLQIAVAASTAAMRQPRCRVWVSAVGAIANRLHPASVRHPLSGKETSP